MAFVVLIATCEWYVLGTQKAETNAMQAPPKKRQRHAYHVSIAEFWPYKPQPKPMNAVAQVDRQF
jgi:hypothetical protein